jgi:hypothetical protein
MVNITSVTCSTCAAYENANLSNVEFTTGPAATGSVLDSWIESGASNTATKTVIWVNLGSNAITGGGTQVIYMDFLPMANTTPVTSGVTGYAPQLDCGGCMQTSYAQYDNGASVFSNYWNFAGTSTPSGWTTYGTGAAFNNMAELSSGSSTGLIETTSKYPIGNTMDFLFKHTSSTDGSGGVLYGADNSGNQYTYTSGWLEVACNPGSICNGISMLYRSPPGTTFLSGSGAGWGYSITTQNSNWITYGLSVIGSSSYIWQNYTASSTTADVPSNGNYYIVMGNNNNGDTFDVQWLRTRITPPNGAMPTATFGAPT